MNLLIITQKVDKGASNLGFFHGWIREFAKNVNNVSVICLYEGKHDLPNNVKVYSLGKEKGVSKLKYIINFYKYIFKLKEEYDSVFVHMNQIYVILGGIFWKYWKKKISLWYTHKSVDLKLEIAEKLVDIIFTASEKSFRLPSRKVLIMNHGIDLNLFKKKKKERNDIYVISTIGRISKSKNIHLLVNAVINLIKNYKLNLELEITGDVMNENDKEYKRKILEKIKEEKLTEKIKFLGPKLHNSIPEVLSSSDLFVNLSDTGSMDKLVLEAMATGMNIVTSNEAFEKIVPKDCFIKSKITLLELKIKDFYEGKINHDLSKYVKENHNLQRLISKVVVNLENL